MSRHDLEKAGLIGSSGREYFYNHIVFPIFDSHGQLVHFQGRSLEKEAKLRWLSSSGKPSSNRYFYNSQALYQPDSSYIVLCEGVSDCLSLLQLGVPAIGQFGINVNLLPHKDAFSQFDGIIAVYDSDKHSLGTKKANTYKSWSEMLPNLVDLMSLSKTPIYYLMPPEEEGIKDINDWLRLIDYSPEQYAAYGKKNLKPIVELAIEMYKDCLPKHEYIWKCFGVDKDLPRLIAWKKYLIEKYGTLEDYLVCCYE